MHDLIRQLNRSGHRLSKSHRAIADYIGQHYEKAVFMTAGKLGECVGVSESTVVRFAAALGYEGYPQLQRAMQELASHRLTAGQWNTFCLPFDATQQQMEQALGCTYELKVHTGMDADGHTMLFGDPATLDIEAGMPYLIRPASHVDSYGVFEDVVYSVNVSNGQNAYNGDGVTFDNQHYFCASLFHGYELSTATDYLCLVGSLT